MADEEPRRIRPQPSRIIAPWVRGALALIVNAGVLYLVYLKIKGVIVVPIPGELWITVGLINGFYFGSPKG